MSGINEVEFWIVTHVAATSLFSMVTYSTRFSLLCTLSSFIVLTNFQISSQIRCRFYMQVSPLYVLTSEPQIVTRREERMGWCDCSQQQRLPISSSVSDEEFTSNCCGIASTTIWQISQIDKISDAQPPQLAVIISKRSWRQSYTWQQACIPTVRVQTR